METICSVAASVLSRIVARVFRYFKLSVFKPKTRSNRFPFA